MQLNSLIAPAKLPFLDEDRSRRTSMFTGDPGEDMEIAKRLIGQFPHVDYRSLMAVASDETQPPSARIAAIYTLGFTDEQRLSRTMLSQSIPAGFAPFDVQETRPRFSH